MESSRSAAFGRTETGTLAADDACDNRGSVRDKIAMFSRAAAEKTTDTAAAAPGSQHHRYHVAGGSTTLPRDRPQHRQWPRSGAPAPPPREEPPPRRDAGADAPHRRSLSLVEQPYSRYFNAVNAYAEMGRSSLNALIEQRRRSMSKLRGLVIPEKAAGAVPPPRPDDAIPDLPLVVTTVAVADDDAGVDVPRPCPPAKTYVNGPPPVTGTATIRASPVVSVSLAPEQRRPSPAPEQRRPSPASSASPSSSPSPSPSSSSSSSSSLNSSREELRLHHVILPPSSASPCKSKSSFKADSDEDSALCSSGRSSTSLQPYSPASSPPPPPPPTAARPPPPNEAGKRVLRAESAEAINRKNVLCSARISSGKKPQQQQQQQSAADQPAKTPAAAAATCSNNRYSHVRMSSVESTTSEESSMQYAVNGEPFGSISSIASSTSLISQQELQQLIDDANQQTLEENGGGGGGVPMQASSVPMSYEVMVIILHRDVATSSAGITLAGGADYETKEITVYKVLTGSPADKDGRIRKGDRILSINGKSMKGITHRESLAILKAPRSEVVLVISRCKSDATVAESQSAHPQTRRDPAISTENDTTANRVFGHLTKVTMCKDGSGLGFSLEGGKNSPTGDQPLVVKKIFTGGCAERCGQISAGDELVSVNDIDITGMSRTEAWNLMKRLVNGTVTLGIRHAV